MNHKHRILCVDDDRDQAELISASLVRLNYIAVTSTSANAALEHIANASFDAVITDLCMSDMDGLVLCEHVLDLRPDLPVIVLTGEGSMERAIGALRVGAYDFLSKPVDAKLLSVTVARAVQHAKLRAELRRLQLVCGESNVDGLIGDSSPMVRLKDLIKRVAASDASVLIRGATGTGKELVAHAIHGASPRSNGPFVALNCAAVPPSLLESELFGHARGAFTDAKNERRGLFLESSGGTLFLDEIGEMPLEMQAKLLRALQERKVRPVGANSEVAFDSRIVTATHRNLEADVASERFRQDLYFRINVVRLDVPALQERGTDILKLAMHFLSSSCERNAKGPLRMTWQVANRMMNYEWPGNVRELENCIERAVAMARFDHLTLDDLPEKLKAEPVMLPESSPSDLSEVLSIEELGYRYIERAITIVGGNKARAAELLGIDRRTLYRRLQRNEDPHPATAQLEAEPVGATP